jgi:cytochrome c biogenesis protein ResB
VKKIFDFISSLTFFFICAGLLLAASMVGGLWLQYPVFGSWPFLGVLGLLALNLAACTARRWKTIALKPGIFLTHLAVLVIFAGGGVHGFLGQRGFMALEIGQQQHTYVTEQDQEKPLPFDVQLQAFRLRYWEPDLHRLHALRRSDGRVVSRPVTLGQTAVLTELGLTVTAFRFYPNFVMAAAGPASRNDAPENPCLEVLVDDGKTITRQFLFALYPDVHQTQAKSGVRLAYEFRPGRIKQFESELAFVEHGQEVAKRTLSVNRPGIWKGWTFYQSGYDQENLKVSILQVSQDPSQYLVISGFVLLLAGLGWTFLREPKRS